MKKSKKQNNQTLYIVVMSVIILLGIGVIVLMPKKQQETKPALVENQELKRYDAQGLKISIDIKNGAVIDDRPNLLVLYYGNDEISGHRIVTDFMTIEEYLADLSTMNHWGKFDQKSITFAEDPTWIEITEYRKRTETSYFVKKGDWVYSFSASSPELEEELKMMLETISFE